MDYKLANYQVFLDLFENTNTDPIAWEAAINANPGEAAKALRTAVFQTISPRSVAEMDRFCQTVVNLALRAKIVEEAAWELCDDLYGGDGDGDGFAVDTLPADAKQKAHALLNALGDG